MGTAVSRDGFSGGTSDFNGQFSSCMFCFGGFRASFRGFGTAACFALMRKRALYMTFLNRHSRCSLWRYATNGSTALRPIYKRRATCHKNSLRSVGALASDFAVSVVAARSCEGSAFVIYCTTARFRGVRCRSTRVADYITFTTRTAFRFMRNVRRANFFGSG